METIDWDQLALSAAERDLAGIVREIAARYAQQGQSITEVSPPAALAAERSGRSNAPGELSETAPALALDWRTLVAIADEAEADIGLHARHEPWVLARLLRLPGDEALRRDGTLPPLDAPVDLHWPDAPAPAVFRAIAAAFADDGWTMPHRSRRSHRHGPSQHGPMVRTVRRVRPDSHRKFKDQRGSRSA